MLFSGKKKRDRTHFFAKRKKIDYSFLLHILEKNVQKLSEISLKTVAPKGNLLVFANGDFYLVFDLAIKAVLTGNVIVLIEENNNEERILIIDILRKALSYYSWQVDIVISYSLIDYKQILGLEKQIDQIIVVGDYDKYDFFRVNTSLPILYSDYTNINIYTDTREFIFTIEQIVKQAEEHQFLVYLYSLTNIEELLQTQRSDFIFHTTIIFTNKIVQTFPFVDKIKSNYIYLNQNPIKELLENKYITLEDYFYQRNILK